jgi:O-antigen ligase
MSLMPIASDPGRTPPAWLAPLIAVAAATLIVLPARFGLLSPPAILVLVPTVLAAVAFVLVRAPQCVVFLIPASLAAPMTFYTYPWEIALCGLLFLLLIEGVRQRAEWLARWSRLEVALAIFTLLGLCSVFWIFDSRTYFIHARRLLLGIGTLWAASRLPYVASKRWFEAGLLGAALSVAIAGLGRWMTSGFTAEEAMIRRPEATNLGWGTANFLATLMMLVTPVVIAIAVESGGVRRVVAWGTVLLVGTLQLLIASRAAASLFLLGTLVQVVYMGRKRRAFSVGIVAAVAGVLVSPLSAGFLERFTSLREMGSITIRIWYWREAWRRVVENLPFGIGLGQGYAYPDHLHATDPHNYWLVVGAELGIPGLLIWIAILVMTWKALGRLGSAPEMRTRVFALRLAFVMAQLHTLVEPTYQGTQYQFLWFWLFGGYLAYGAAEAASANSRR